MLIITDSLSMELPEATQLTSMGASLFIAGELRKKKKKKKKERPKGKLAKLEVKEQKVTEFRKTGKLVINYSNVSQSCTSCGLGFWFFFLYFGLPRDLSSNAVINGTNTPYGNAKLR